MAEDPPITELLAAWRGGDDQARIALFEAVYDDLHAMAYRRQRHVRGDHTMRPTALVHELYLKLTQQAAVSARDQGHFFAVAARAMRHILIDYVRKWDRRQQVTLGSEQTGRLDMPAHEVQALGEALEKLRAYGERLVQVVEMNYFAGLTYDEIADAMGVTKRTITRDMAKAKALLRELLEEGAGAKSSNEPS